MDWKIAFYELDYDEDEVNAVADVVRSRQLARGPHTEAFEEEARGFLGCDHAILVSSGSAAIHLALRALDIGVRDQVLLPSLCHVMAAHAVMLSGATPAFVDILHPENPTIDVEDAAAKVTHHTKAILPLHYGGFACQMSPLKKLRAPAETSEEGVAQSDESLAPRKRKSRTKAAEGDSLPPVALVENAGHAMGGSDATGLSLGTSGRLGCYNFFVNKQLVAGNGGLIATNDEALAARIRQMRAFSMIQPSSPAGVVSIPNGKGTTHHPTWAGYEVTDMGYDYRAGEIAAVLARIQLRKLPRQIERRAALFQLYHELLADVEELTLPFRNPRNWGEPAYLFVPVLCRDAESRAALAKSLAAAGIQTEINYRPIHTLKYYSAIVLKQKPVLPQTEAYAQRALSLPLHGRMAEADVLEVVKAIKESLVRS